MKKSILLFICLAIAGFVSAQQSEAVLKVKDGSDLSKIIPFAERFYYDKFQNGTVFFRNGRKVKANMNYSLVHGEVQFIDAKKDTLILNDKNLIDKISIATDTFFYYERYGHVKKIAVFNHVVLAEKPFITTMDSERHAAYGQYSSTSAISTYSSFTSSSGLQQTLEGSDKVLLKKGIAFFFLDQNRDVLLATKGNLLKLYPKHKKSLNAYFKENKTEFDSKENITRVLEYAGAL